MRAKKKPISQLNFLAPTLKEQLNPTHELYLLSQEIDWDCFEEELKYLYSDKGRPADPFDGSFVSSQIHLQSIYPMKF